MAPFYEVPFKKNHWYVTKCNVFGLIEKLKEGTEIKYKWTGNSSYDGMIGFFFEDRDGNDRRWDIYDDTDPKLEAEKLFIEIKED